MQEYSTKSRGNGRIFTRGKIREHWTGGGSLLGELTPSTGRVMGDIVALGVLATLEARMRFEGKGEE